MLDLAGEQQTSLDIDFDRSVCVLELVRMAALKMCQAPGIHQDLCAAAHCVTQKRGQLVIPRAGHEDLSKKCGRSTSATGTMMKWISVWNGDQPLQACKGRAAGDLQQPAVSCGKNGPVCAGRNMIGCNARPLPRSRCSER